MKIYVLHQDNIIPSHYDKGTSLDSDEDPVLNLILDILGPRYGYGAVNVLT
jgi:hypothetical protein